MPDNFNKTMYKIIYKINKTILQNYRIYKSFQTKVEEFSSQFKHWALPLLTLFTSKSSFSSHFFGDFVTGSMKPTFTFKTFKHAYTIIIW